MIARIVELSLIQRVLVCILGFLLFFGGLYAFHTLDVDRLSRSLAADGRADHPAARVVG